MILESWYEPKDDEIMRAKAGTLRSYSEQRIILIRERLRSDIRSARLRYQGDGTWPTPLELLDMMEAVLEVAGGGDKK